jgi:hypothetical protein
VLFVTGNVPPPDVPAVLGEPIVLVRLCVFRLSYGPMTCGTFHFSQHHMSCVREENALGLAGIDEPGDFLAGLNIFLDELGFLGMLTHLLFMTLEAVLQLRNPVVSSILTEIVAGFTIAHFRRMKLVVEVNRLFFLCV